MARFAVPRATIIFKLTDCTDISSCIDERHCSVSCTLGLTPLETSAPTWMTQKLTAALTVISMVVSAFLQETQRGNKLAREAPGDFWTPPARCTYSFLPNSVNFVLSKRKKQSTLNSHKKGRLRPSRGRSMKDHRELEVSPSFKSGTIRCRCKGCAWNRIVLTDGYDVRVDAAVVAFRSHECDNYPTQEEVDRVVAHILGRT